MCSNVITSYSAQLDHAFPADEDRHRRDVADDVRESRQRRAVDGFTSDGMEVSIQIGSKKTQVNPSSIQGKMRMALNSNRTHNSELRNFI